MPKPEEWGNFADPLKKALGLYLQGFQRVLVPDTRAVLDFMRRPFSSAVKLAPDRMIDQVEELIDAYRKNDNVTGAQPVTALPVLIIAVDKSYTPSGPEYGRPMANAQFVVMPEDPKQRIFKLRTVTRDFRSQIVVLAPEGVSASSLAMQLHLYCSAPTGRSMLAQHSYAGVKTLWPVQIEDTEVTAVSSISGEEVKNLTALAIDLTLRATIPIYSAPAEGETNDGLGTSNSPANPFADDHDPSGYPRVSGLTLSRSPNADMSHAHRVFSVLYAEDGSAGSVEWTGKP